MAEIKTFGVYQGEVTLSGKFVGGIKAATLEEATAKLALNLKKNGFDNVESYDDLPGTVFFSACYPADQVGLPDGQKELSKMAMLQLGGKKWSTIHYSIEEMEFFT
jgi:hypothetical protein